MKYRLLIIALLTFSMAQLKAQLVITEIMYNNPGTDLFEYIEILNTGGTPINMQDYYFSEGVTLVFPDLEVAGGEFVVVTNDPVALEINFGVTGALEFTGALNNSGENIVLNDAGGTILDEVSYDDGETFHQYADGFGSSLVLCDPSSDNSLAFNWQIASTASGFTFNGVEIYANPGAASLCSPGPIVGFLGSSDEVNEGIGEVSIDVILDNAGSNFTLVDVTINSASTADDMDYILNTSSLNFPAGSEENQIVSISILDDGEMEGDEQIVLELSNVGNSGVLIKSLYTITIIDNDVDLNSNLVLAGIFDAQPGTTGTKGIELYVLDDIPDLSVYGLGIANNGGGSDGKEYDFPAVSATAGQRIFVAEDSLEFANFFGIPATFINQIFTMNGDDSIELFESGQVIDAFGDVALDGTGEPWEYTDGWAYRISGTGPDGSSFVLENWKFGGIDALDGGEDNVTSPTPYPLGTYSPVPPEAVESFEDNVTTEVNTTVEIKVLANDILPNDVTTLLVLDLPANGMALVNGDSTISYTPNLDFCGDDSFRYTVCDANSCDTAFVNIVVECPPTFPVYSIGDVNTSDTNGVPDSLGVTCQLEGIVYGVNLGAQGINFAMIDGNNEGIIVFNNDFDFGYTVNEGDQVVVLGEIDQFNGLTEIIADTVYTVPLTMQTISPDPVTALNEETESSLIVLEGVSFLDETQWGMGTASGFNFDVTNGTGTYQIRIDAQVDLFNLPIPGGDPTMGAFRITGIGGQFDNSSPYDEGYQLLPRYETDIEYVVSVQDPILGESISISPNPVATLLNIKLEENCDQITLYAANGKVLKQINDPLLATNLDLSVYESGIYFLVFTSGENTWIERVIKQ